MADWGQHRDALGRLFLYLEGKTREISTPFSHVRHNALETFRKLKEVLRSAESRWATFPPAPRLGPPTISLPPCLTWCTRDSKSERYWAQEKAHLGCVYWWNRGFLSLFRHLLLHFQSVWDEFLGKNIYHYSSLNQPCLGPEITQIDSHLSSRDSPSFLVQQQPNRHPKTSIGRYHGNPWDPSSDWIIIPGTVRKIQTHPSPSVSIPSHANLHPDQPSSTSTT